MSDLLTVEEVADRLRLHEMTVRRHIKAGRLRAVRVGRRVRVREEDLAAFVKPAEGVHELTREELREKFLKPPTKEEIERRRRLIDEMRRLREEIGPIDISTSQLVRMARREREVLYEGKTWDEVI